MKRFASTIAAIWRLSVPYFHSDDRWPGRILLGAVIAIELSLVALDDARRVPWPPHRTRRGRRYLSAAGGRAGFGGRVRRNARAEPVG